MKGLLVGLVAAAVIIAACKSDTTSTPPVVASVTVLPALDSAQVVTDTMLQPRVAQLAAVLKDASGNVLSVVQTGQTVIWTSSAPAVATVDRYGLVKGVAAGSATITASIEAQKGTSTAKVIAVSVVAVSVKPAPDSVAVGKSVTLRATPTDARGDTLVAKKTHWTSSDTTVAVVTNADSLGMAPGNSAVIKGVKVGTATITATISGVSGTSAMKVLP
jgi:uncharacterized protein YjdB